MIVDGEKDEPLIVLLEDWLVYISGGEEVVAFHDFEREIWAQDIQNLLYCQFIINRHFKALIWLRNLVRKETEQFR
jgi:hypothetical protein